MKTTILAAVIAALGHGLAVPVFAQPPGAAQAAQPPQVAASAADLTDGEIRKVDKDGKKLTIRHGEIKSLDMPPMTMVFQVRDAAMLDVVKPGDKVRFAVQKSDAGLVVTVLQAAP